MKKNAKILISIVLCVSLVMSFFGCTGKSDSKSISLPQDKIYAENTDASVHYCNTDGLKEIDASGLITLLYDEISSAVCVRITNSNESKLWSALPQVAENVYASEEADIVSLEVIHDGKIYCLNSQDNSVLFGGVYTDLTEKGFEVTYLITDNGDWLTNIDLGATDEAYSSAAEGSILFKVVASYYLNDGCFYAELDWFNLGDEDDVLLDIGFLGYFGADQTAAEGDYILVPDGSGALINTASSESVEPIDIAVYGNDISGNGNMKSVVAAYGMKSGNDAFAAVIENGDAAARITANKVQCESDYNRVGPVFTVSQSMTDNEKLYYSDFAYNEGSTVCFRFLSGANATYAGMAAACREQLIRNHTLSTRSVELTEYMPILVNVVGSAASDSTFAVNKKLTDFNEANDILGRLKSKGINNVYLRYTGALSGGLNEKNAYDASPVGSLGGMSGVKNLDSYAASLNFSVFYDIALISDTSSDSSALRNVNGEKLKINFPDVFTSSGFPAKNSARYMLGSSALEKTVLNVLERFDSLVSTGYCITDAGTVAYTDIAGGVCRQTAIKTISEKMAPLSTSSRVMVKGGNFYSLKNADVISDMPMKCSRTESEAYTSVPFIQIILHGIVEFTYDGINLSSDSKTAILRCVEYGALPGYVLTNNMFDDSEKYTSMFGVDNWLNSMYDVSFSAGEVLNDLRGSRITNHYVVSEGVYCTEYESTTRIYVNYTEEPVTVSGITVEPMSFFRVN
ncbi:MAG: hypothetical protein IJA87_05730 [Clostridia bacterium]|nr:hypothetical protein [Clostridia bacterium]